MRKSFEQIEREGRENVALLRAAPHAPMASRAEVLEIACGGCGAEPGEECATAFPRVAFFAGMLFGPEFGGMHLRRYLDRTGDPR